MDLTLIAQCEQTHTQDDAPSHHWSERRNNLGKICRQFLTQAPDMVEAQQDLGLLSGIAPPVMLRDMARFLICVLEAELNGEVVRCN
jgi:hypothetical protein